MIIIHRYFYALFSEDKIGCGKAKGKLFKSQTVTETMSLTLNPDQSEAPHFASEDSFQVAGTQPLLKNSLSTSDISGTQVSLRARVEDLLQERMKTLLFPGIPGAQYCLLLL